MTGGIRNRTPHAEEDAEEGEDEEEDNQWMPHRQDLVKSWLSQTW